MVQFQAVQLVRVGVLKPQPGFALKKLAVFVGSVGTDTNKGLMISDIVAHASFYFIIINLYKILNSTCLQLNISLPVLIVFVGTRSHIKGRNMLPRTGLRKT